jgi:AcrR family transcriptional regulator
MADRVKSPKGKRRYNSARRQEQAAGTRRDILDAAMRLFEKRGYAATTMAAVAAEAGVALKTVYLAFETKSGILRTHWNERLRGTGLPVPVAEQPWYREVMAEPDAEQQLRLVARYSRAAKQRIAPLFNVIRDAAPVDPDIAALWKRIQTEFHANQRTIVDSLHKKGVLKAGLDVDRGADILWMLNNPDVWQLLVGERGWTPEQHEQWLFETARAQLLRDDPKTKRRS